MNLDEGGAGGGNTNCINNLNGADVQSNQNTPKVRNLVGGDVNGEGL